MAEGGDVEQQRPGARRTHRRQTVELAERLVASPLALGVCSVQVVVAQAEGNTRSDLSEPARDQTVVDLDARNVVDNLTRSDDPTDPPGDHPLLERHAPHDDRSIAHVRKRSRMPDRAAVEEHAFEPRQVQEPHVALAADRGNGLPFLVAGDPPGRQRRAADEKDARSLVHGGPQNVEVESPLAVGDPERDETRDGADEPHPIDHARVGRVGEDDLVAGIR